MDLVQAQVPLNMRNIILSSRRIKQDVTLTDIFSETAVHVEGIVTKLIIGVRSLEEETVRAELLLWDLSRALVVFITLFWVWEEAVWFWTLEKLT